MQQDGAVDDWTGVDAEAPARLDDEVHRVGRDGRVNRRHVGLAAAERCEVQPDATVGQGHQRRVERKSHRIGQAIDDDHDRGAPGASLVSGEVDGDLVEVGVVVLRKVLVRGDEAAVRQPGQRRHPCARKGRQCHRAGAAAAGRRHVHDVNVVVPGTGCARRRPLLGRHRGHPGEDECGDETTQHQEHQNKQRGSEEFSTVLGSLVPEVVRRRSAAAHALRGRWQRHLRETHVADVQRAF